jgi:hypothetical protein
MQVTVEVPDQLANRLPRNQNELAEILENGLRIRDWVGVSTVANEVINFLARGPKPEAIVAFHPSSNAAARTHELLERNRSGSLSPSERAELDEMALLDQLMTLVKARAFEQTKAR